MTNKQVATQQNQQEPPMPQVPMITLGSGVIVPRSIMYKVKSRETWQRFEEQQQTGGSLAR